MPITKAPKLSYSLKELSELTGISVDVLWRHIDGLTDTPLVATWPSSKAMVDHAEYQRWWDTLPKEKP